MASEHTFHNTALWREPLLEALRSIPIMTRAARKVGIHPSRVYQVMKEDPEFEEAVREAKAEGDDSLETAAFKRAVHGVVKGVWHNGVRVGEEKVYSDTLLVALLKGRKKEIYSDRTELTGANGEPLQIKSMDDTARSARATALMHIAATRKTVEELRKAVEDLC
jgi:hypothetical protein